MEDDTIFYADNRPYKEDGGDRDHGGLEYAVKEGRTMLNKEKECARLKKLGEILGEAEKALETVAEIEDRGKQRVIEESAYEYVRKLREMKKAIDNEIIEEQERVESFRRALYSKLAYALTVAFGVMAAVSGVCGTIQLIKCIGNGTIHVLGALAWGSITVGLIFLTMIAASAWEAIAV